MRPEELPDDDELLAQYAKPVGDEWTLQGPGHGVLRTRTGMLALIKMYLLLDQEPTDIATAEMMYEVVRRVAALEG